MRRSFVATAAAMAVLLGGPAAFASEQSAGRIFFTSDRTGTDSDIFSMRTDGSDVRDLTNTPDADESDVSVSPDGTEIVYSGAPVADGPGHNSLSLYVANADGSDPVRITDDPRPDFQASWSPDGRRIAFTRYVKYGTFEIWTVTPDGGHHHRVLTSYADEEASWSPDGGSLVFDSDRGNNFDIYKVNWDGTALTRLTTSQALDLSPSWSPDGLQVAYISDYRLWVMNADGSNQHQILFSPPFGAFEVYPSWSPDSRHIVFTKSTRSSFEICEVQPDGAHSHCLTKNNSNDSDPTWGRAL